MKNLIIIVGLVILAIAIYGVITGDVQTAVKGLMTRAAADIDLINP